jgi:hypothetical protein
MGASLDPESADRTESDSFFDDKPWRGVAEQEDRITVECPDRPPDVSLATIFRATGDLVAHLKGATFKQHAVRVTVDDQPSPFEFLVHGDGKLIVWNQSLAKEG